jgi:hypothetical protein
MSDSHRDYRTVGDHLWFGKGVLGNLSEFTEYVSWYLQHDNLLSLDTLDILEAGTLTFRPSSLTS